jgi:hypothetical protein
MNKYKATEEKTKSDIIREFIYSIESKKYQGLPYYNIDIDKQLFELTYNFNIKDWKNVRTKEYWLQNSLIHTEQKRKEYLLKQVKLYKEMIFVIENELPCEL